jgi:AraC family transcriptional activator of pobA
MASRDPLISYAVAVASPSTRFLFAQSASAGRGQGAANHRHPFWQLELVTAGRARARCDGERLALGRGAILLIPPGVEHGFDYLARSTAWLSVKFSAAGWKQPSRALLLRQVEARTIVVALRGLCADGAPRPAGRGALDHLLAALMAVVAESAAALAAPSLAERVRALIERHEGRAWTVAQVAHVLNCSPGHCSARFRSECGIRIKPFIDRLRADRAAALLAYSEDSVGAVAARLGFGDAFAFSRFFRRVKGSSPSAFRARQGVEGSGV